MEIIPHAGIGGRHLQQLGSVCQPEDLVEHDALTAEVVEERFGVLHGPARPGQFAVVVDHVLQGSAKAGFPDAAHPGQPDHGSLVPCLLDPFSPFLALNHAQP
jgi:hypothetical protein